MDPTGRATGAFVLILSTFCSNNLIAFELQDKSFHGSDKNGYGCVRVRACVRKGLGFRV